VSIGAEIALVSERRVLALAVLHEHSADRFGMCVGCGDRTAPCSRSRQASRVFAWAERRVVEIDEQLSATVSALRAPLMRLPEVSASGAAPR
jgi:hypothetical protein